MNEITKSEKPSPLSHCRRYIPSGYLPNPRPGGDSGVPSALMVLYLENNRISWREIGDGGVKAQLRPLC